VYGLLEGFLTSSPAPEKNVRTFPFPHGGQRVYEFIGGEGRKLEPLLPRLHPAIFLYDRKKGKRWWFCLGGQKMVLQPKGRERENSSGGIWGIFLTRANVLRSGKRRNSRRSFLATGRGKSQPAFPSPTAKKCSNQG